MNTFFLKKNSHYVGTITLALRTITIWWGNSALLLTFLILTIILNYFMVKDRYILFQPIYTQQNFCLMYSLHDLLALCRDFTKLVTAWVCTVPPLFPDNLF